MARRILVGDAGQRVQGLLKKLGLTRSYVMVNTPLYCIYGQFDPELKAFTDLPEVAQWRNQLLAALAGPNIQAILAMGQAAQHVVDTWPGAATFTAAGRVFKMLHPTAPAGTVGEKRRPMRMASGICLPILPVRSPEQDLADIPLRDFGFGAPAWMGTGNMATRLQAGKLPAMAKKNSTILWCALDKLG